MKKNISGYCTKS